MFEITISESNGKVPVTIMTLKGDLDTLGADVFDAQIQQIKNGNSKNVLVDMSGVPYMSSAGLRSIHNLYYTLHPEGSKDHKRIIKEGIRDGSFKAPHMKLLNPSKRVMELLEMVGVDMYMEILKGDKEDAVKSF